ncbi:phage tail assembly protein [Kribbella deserti]|uniref:Phage tail assembly protein n=1 Tax=Kribbella deserti TaxID=1926257 RepID=A0ABV6QDV1_9ACTN
MSAWSGDCPVYVPAKSTIFTDASTLYGESLSTFTLDDIRTAAERKYGSTDIALTETETLRLLNPLRLSKQNRTALIATQEKLSDEDADQETILADCIRLIADSDAKATKLLDAIDGDLAMLMEVFERYSAGVQVGEASASQD